MRRVLITALAVAAAWPAGAAAFTGAATNAASGAVAASVFRPVSVTPPAVTGSLRAGETVTASPGDWDREPDRFTYVWQRCDEAACRAVADGRSYLLTDADAGRTMRVLVTASNAGGDAVRASAPSARVDERARPPVSTASPTVEGPAEEGATLTATPGQWNTAADSAVRWQRCAEVCVDVPGATAWRHRPSAADVDRRLRAVVTATNGGGSTSAASDSTSVIRSEAAMYAEAVLSDRPALYWRLDGATPEDASGNGRHGQRLAGSRDATGAMTASGSHVQPRLDLARAALADARTATIEAWVRRAPSARPEAIAVVGDNSAGFGLHTADPASAAGGPCLWLVNFHVWSFRDDRCSLATGAWTHVAAVIDQGSERVYIDGALAGGPWTASALTPRARFTVGFAYADDGMTSQNPQLGAIDDVAVYGTALSAERIRAHFERGTQGG